MWQFRRSDLPSARRRWRRRRKFEGVSGEEEEAQDRYDDEEEEDPLWDYEEYDEEDDGYGEVGLRSRYDKNSHCFRFICEIVFHFPDASMLWRSTRGRSASTTWRLAASRATTAARTPSAGPTARSATIPQAGIINSSSSRTPPGTGITQVMTLTIVSLMTFYTGIFM